MSLHHARCYLIALAVVLVAVEAIVRQSLAFPVGDAQLSSQAPQNQLQSSPDITNAISNAGPGAPMTQPVNGGLQPGTPPQPQSSSAQAQQQSAQQQQQQLLSAQAKLPKINIYISRNEIKKLLGIDNARLNYVSEGNVNSYPFGFTIPLGYNQSDIIFTWQNLGPTNVNYSISLVIGNIQAVDPPLINITRSGLIPHNEQVFKITLPCSGRVTDEVDVQVLINVSGLVPVDELGVNEGGAAPSLDLAAAASASAPVPASSPEAAGSNEAPTTTGAAEPGAQADQPASPINGGAQTGTAAAAAAAEKPQPRMKMISHTLAIKRKKICTMHPVPVTPRPVIIAPPQAPSQLPGFGQQPARVPQPPVPAPPSQPLLLPPPPPPPPTTMLDPRRSPVPGPTQLGSEPPQQLSPSPPDNNKRTTQQVHTEQMDNASPEAPSTFQQLNTISLPPPNGLYPNWSPQSVSTPAHHQAASRPTIAPDNPLNDILLAHHKQVVSNGNSHNNFVGQAQPTAGHQPSSASAAGAGSSPMFVAALVGVAALVSIASMLVLLLGSQHNNNNNNNNNNHHHSRHHGIPHHHRSPFDKLSRASSWIMRRASPSRNGAKAGAGLRGSGVGPQTILPSALFGSLRAVSAGATKPTSTGVTSVSSLTMGKQANNDSNSPPAFCYKPNYPNGYYTTGAQQPQYGTNSNNNQHIYQQPPTADLLGTGYICQSQQQQQSRHLQQQQQQHYPIYHIATGNTSQTTRLIWTQGNGNSPDGFTVEGGTGSNAASSYMPALTRSETGSVYQTIY